MTVKATGSGARRGDELYRLVEHAAAGFVAAVTKVDNVIDRHHVFDERHRLMYCIINAAVKTIKILLMIVHPAKCSSSSLCESTKSILTYNLLAHVEARNR